MEHVVPGGGGFTSESGPAGQPRGAPALGRVLKFVFGCLTCSTAHLWLEAKREYSEPKHTIRAGTRTLKLLPTTSMRAPQLQTANGWTTTLIEGERDFEVANEVG
jgi:hypothetical protein